MGQATSKEVRPSHYENNISEEVQTTNTLYVKSVDQQIQTNIQHNVLDISNKETQVFTLSMETTETESQTSYGTTETESQTSSETTETESQTSSETTETESQTRSETNESESQTSFEIIHTESQTDSETNESESQTSFATSETESQTSVHTTDTQSQVSLETTHSESQTYCEIQNENNKASQTAIGTHVKEIQTEPILADVVPTCDREIQTDNAPGVDLPFDLGAEEPDVVPYPRRRIYKLVLTGGPCGGKTTSQARLSTFFENMGWKVYRVPETASVLLSGGVKFKDLSDKEGLQFQENLLKTMLQVEQSFFKLADTCPKNCLIICDRGAMDASAFVPTEQWEDMMSKNGWNTTQLRDNRYDQVLHMVSAANGAEDFYSVADHSCRSEGVELARFLDGKAAEAWVGHPYFDVIDNTTDFNTKIRRMIHMVCKRLGIDTGDSLSSDARKLKFLVKGPIPDGDSFPVAFRDFEVEHIYLRSDSESHQARIRRRTRKGKHSYTHTLRKTHMGQKMEVKTTITRRDWMNISQQADSNNHHIYKQRRCFLHNNQYFTLDIYQEPCHDRCKDLVLLETVTTLSNEELAKRLPDFLNIEEDVTSKSKYSMYNLSLKEN